MGKETTRELKWHTGKYLFNTKVCINGGIQEHKRHKKYRKQIAKLQA